MTALAEAGIVTGLSSEAKIARRLSSRVVCSGGEPEIAARLAEELIRDGAQCLVSFGIAGGLSPDLRPGALVIASEVLTKDARYPADSALSNALSGFAVVGPIYGGTKIVANSGCKQELANRTKALAIDLESGPTARAAANASIPFIAIRAIADPAWRGLPPAALIPLLLTGRPNLVAVFASIAKRPGQIPGLIATAFDTRAALNALFRACSVLV